MESHDNEKSYFESPLGEATLVVPVLTQLIKERFLPKVHLGIMEELLFLMRGEIMGEDP